MKNITYASNSTKPRVTTGKTPIAITEKTEPITTKLLVSFAVAVALLIGISLYSSASNTALDTDSALTLSIFVLAIWAWIFSPLSDTYVSLATMLLLVLSGVLDSDQMVESLGTSSIWLLVAAFILAQAITASGLTQRLTAWLITRARSTRSLMHLLNISLFITAFLVPSTSGRAALALPIFLELTKVLSEHRELIKALSLLIPATILLSAISSYIGAGAHLITDEILGAADYEQFGFLRWLLLGAGLGLIASVVCTELVHALFLSRESRTSTLHISYEDLEEESDTPLRGVLTVGEQKVLVTMAIVVALWVTDSLHGLEAVTVAWLGALAVSSPKFGNVNLTDGIKKAPWTLLLFMAATLALGTALQETGTATWLAESLFAPAQSLGDYAGIGFLVLVILISTAAHLVIQSRSARSAVLVPLIITAAVPLGVNPAAAAFISTAAAGFCHTMTSSAKPVALFSDVKDVPTYDSADLLKLSMWLAPAHIVTLLVFTFLVWPLQGLQLFMH